MERFYTFPTIASTNEFARKLSHAPKSGIYCIQADRQIAGRGRRGGEYFSDCPGGVWVSLVVPVPDIAEHFRYNRAISLAILLTLSQCGKDLPIRIKWPNDIYWGERKICGILLESHPEFPGVVIIGFGLNVNITAADFPDELSSIATSVEIETGRRCALTAVLRTILKQFNVIRSAESAKVHEAYISRLFGRGRRVRINEREGVSDSVAEDGTLQLIVDGTTVAVSTGSPVFLDRDEPAEEGDDAD